MNSFDLNVEDLSGVGQKRANLYKKISIKTIEDLIYYFPRSYIDFDNIKPLDEVCLYEMTTVMLKVCEIGAPKFLRGGRTLYNAMAVDENGSVIEIVYFNNPYTLKSIKPDEFYLFHGKIEGNLYKKKMINPKLINVESKGYEGVYKLTKGLTSNMIRTNLKEALTHYKQESSLPQWFIKKYNLIDLKDALIKIHFPKSLEDIENARLRIVYEELLVWQLSLLILRKKSTKQTDIVLKDTQLAPFLNNLPFTLTDAQKRVINDIIDDCLQKRPMNRLVQGDVGSGKTVVAATILYLFAKSGIQGAMMAPTELLARQHYDTLKSMLDPLGVKTSLLVGSFTEKEKKLVREDILNADVDVVVGTQTLFQQKTKFKSLGIVITDEQHRFGVKQREMFAKKGNNPHVLVMSATPIPRSLALIIYGDMDISTIDTLPSGRQKIDTYFVSDDKRTRVFNFIKKFLDDKKQGYIVCPMVEDNESQCRAVNSYAKSLKEEVFKQYNVGVLHGKLKKEEKEDTMEAFARGKIDLLIATTVIEVGIDVKSAVIMVIENAEMFGLSQLHQLRGRVGRGNDKSYCILISSLRTKDNIKRLKTMCSTNDGFLIAKMDLELRGPGDFFGDRQHGLPKFKIADIFLDMKTLNICKKEAGIIYNKDKDLTLKENALLKQKIDDLIDKDIL